MNGFAWSKCVRTSRVAALGMLAGVLAASSGCQTAHPSDRVDPYSRPGDAALNDPAVSPRTLLEFTDQVTQRLADRIPTIPAIKDSPQKAVIVVGAITNNTRTPSNDFLAIRSKIFTNLVNSNVQEHALILETLETMDEQASRYAQGGGAVDSARYDPAITYILNGEFGEISRDSGRDSTYIFNWKLVNLRTSVVVFADQVTATQSRTR